VSLVPTQPAGAALDLGSDPATALTVLGGQEVALLHCLVDPASAFVDTQLDVPIYNAAQVTAPLLIVLADPGRVELILTNLGPGIIWWGRTPQVIPQPAAGKAAQTGGQKIVSGQSWIFDYRTAGAAYYAWTDPSATEPAVVAISRASTSPTA